MRVLIAFLWLLHWLPLPVLGRFGEAVGSLLFLVLGKRRHIALTNLRLCMPELSEKERERIARQHFRDYSRSIFERSIIWWAPEARVRSLIQVEPAVPQEGEGVWAPFFGRNAYTMTLPAKLAQLGKADILLVYAERLPKGRGYVVRFVPFEGDLSGTAAEQAVSINRAMEQLIARCPAQYFWSYNRYKQPDGVPAPDAEVAA